MLLAGRLCWHPKRWRYIGIHLASSSFWLGHVMALSPLFLAAALVDQFAVHEGEIDLCVPDLVGGARDDVTVKN